MLLINCYYVICFHVNLTFILCINDIIKTKHHNVMYNNVHLKSKQSQILVAGCSPPRSSETIGAIYIRRTLFIVSL